MPSKSLGPNVVIVTLTHFSAGNGVCCCDTLVTSISGDEMAVATLSKGEDHRSRQQGFGNHPPDADGRPDRQGGVAHVPCPR